MRFSRTNRGHQPRFQGLAVGWLFMAMLAGLSSSAAATKNASDVDAVLVAANARIRNGERAESVETWLNATLKENGLVVRSAPPSWDTYGQASWQRDLRTSATPPGVINANAQRDGLRSLLNGNADRAGLLSDGALDAFEQIGNVTSAAPNGVPVAGRTSSTSEP